MGRRPGAHVRHTHRLDDVPPGLRTPPVGERLDLLNVSDQILGLADSRDTTVLAWVALTLAFRANAQLSLGEFAGAIVISDDILRRFSSREERPSSEVTADASR